MKLSSTFIRCPLLLSRIKFSKCQAFFEHQDVSRVPNFFGQKFLKINLYSFSSQAKISRIAQKNSKHIGKEI
jgi:hypothetical protein